MNFMAFRTFDQTVKCTPKLRSTVTFLTLNERGKVNISQAARRWFSLQEGDRIIFHQDLEFRSHWFIQFTKEARGYKIVFGPTDTRFSAVRPVSEIFKSIGKQPQKLTFLISKRPLIIEETPFYLIELQSLLNK
jgi:hypothetical protein